MLPLSASGARRRLKALALVGALAFLAVACSHRPMKPRRTSTSQAPTTAETTSTTESTTSTSTTSTTEPTTTTTSTTTPTSTTTTSTTAPTGNAVTYDLANFTITLTSGAITAGMNTVTVTNTGTAPHEINFVRAATAASLPKTANGAVDFAQVPMMDQLGVLRAAAGTTATGVFTFTPGSYVALCNVGATGANPHVARGMFIEFSVA